MKVTITENILIGGQHHEAGTVMDMEDGQAQTLILMKRAAFVDSDPEADQAAADQAAADLAAADQAAAEKAGKHK